MDSEQFSGRGLSGYEHDKDEEGLKKLIETLSTEMQGRDIVFFDTNIFGQRAFDYLKDQGLIKNIGVCNFNVERLMEAQNQTKNKIVLNQVHYNLIFREPIKKGVVEYCQNNDIFIEAWRPVQQGSLAKKGIDIVDKLCEKYNKTPAQIAINWLVSQKNVITLVKASNIKHLEEDIGAVGWSMSDEDVLLLTNNYPIQLDRSNAVQLK